MSKWLDLKELADFETDTQEVLFHGIGNDDWGTINGYLTYADLKLLYLEMTKRIPEPEGE